MARQDRHSDDWYIGAVTDEQARDITIGWSFLPEGITYTAQVYRDADDADWQTNPYATSIETMTVSATSEPFTLRLASGGGCAIRLQAE